MRRIAGLMVAMVTVLALATGARAMDIVALGDQPERSQREMQEETERRERMQHAEELEREAHELMQRAEELRAEEGAEGERRELRLQANRMMAEAEELRRDLMEGPEVREPRLPRGIVLPYGLRQPAAPKALVLPLEGMEPEQIARMAEDLSVMSRILEKVLAREFRGERDIAAPGMPGGPFSRLLGEESIPSMYLQGYGALFFLRVNFPLAGPVPEPQEEPQGEQDNLWDQTRREMHGAGGVGSAYGGPAPGGFVGFGAGSEWRNRVDWFDPERVERLKRTVLDTLRHAAHIRALGRDESVTVVVFGAERVGPSVLRLGPAGGFDRGPAFAGRAGIGAPSTGRTGTGARSFGGGAFDVRGTNVVATLGREPRREGDVLVIRAVKKDIDALAEGRLKPDEFAEKASVMIQ